MQRACAQRYASHKFLFFDSSKFKKEGNSGYKLYDLLNTSEIVTIYTVTSEKDEWIKLKFDLLGQSLLDNEENNILDKKYLRLRIVGKDDTASFSAQFQGVLRQA